VFGSLPDTHSLTLPLALTASLLRCERREAKKRDRRRRKHTKASATGASPSQNWTLWPTLVPPVLFSFPFNHSSSRAHAGIRRGCVVVAGGHRMDEGVDLSA
jgi:hypothetical protein